MFNPRLITRFAVFLALGMLLQHAAQATVLTFDITGAANFSSMDQNYGDRVTAATMGIYGYGGTFPADATPNILTSYSSDIGLQFTAGGLTNAAADYSPNSPNVFIRFDADAGFLVNLFSFDLSLGTNTTIFGFVIKDGSNNTLFTSGNITFATAATIVSSSFPMLSSSTLIIEILNGRPGGGDTVVGIDNIAFTQSVVSAPEPSTWALLLVALSGLGLVKLRRIGNSMPISKELAA